MYICGNNQIHLNMSSFIWNFVLDHLLKWFERSENMKTYIGVVYTRSLHVIFIKIKLSSRLCLTHKRVTEV